MIKTFETFKTNKKQWKEFYKRCKKIENGGKGCVFVFDGKAMDIANTRPEPLLEAINDWKRFIIKENLGA